MNVEMCKPCFIRKLSVGIYLSRRCPVSVKLIYITRV